MCQASQKGKSLSRTQRECPSQNWQAPWEPSVHVNPLRPQMGDFLHFRIPGLEPCVGSLLFLSCCDSSAYLYKTQGQEHLTDVFPSGIWVFKLQGMDRCMPRNWALSISRVSGSRGHLRAWCMPLHGDAGSPQAALGHLCLAFRIVQGSSGL